MILSWKRDLKRLFDLLLSAAGLIFFALPMFWIAWRLRRELALPALFLQPRIGCGGKLFLILKFRTYPEGGRQPTPFGQWLRATAMDELPQLINIMRGEMSFVGPRPLVPEELQGLSRFPQGIERQSVRPGLTGPAQLFGEKVPLLPERLVWDLAYVRDCSFRMDMKILLASVRTSLKGRWEKAGPKAAGRGA